jgi:hypothetical protein
VIEQIYIADYDEKYAPPERVLEVGISGDLLFLTPGRWTSDHETRTFTAVEDASIGVPIADIVNAINSLVKSQERYDLKRVYGEESLRAKAVTS